jgi:hypothetical protein
MESFYDRKKNIELNKLFNTLRKRKRRRRKIIDIIRKK